MRREIKQSDWKILRRLHRVALDRFCQRVIQDVRSLTDACDHNYHDCYLKLFQLLRRRDRAIARAFDDLRRSNAFILLANIKEEGLLTDAELSEFSDETREALEMIESVRRG